MTYSSRLSWSISILLYIASYWSVVITTPYGLLFFNTYPPDSDSFALSKAALGDCFISVILVCGTSNIFIFIPPHICTLLHHKKRLNIVLKAVFIIIHLQQTI